jgi:hypothetical protein
MGAGSDDLGAAAGEVVAWRGAFVGPVDEEGKLKYVFEGGMMAVSVEQS